MENERTLMILLKDKICIDDCTGVSDVAVEE
jgi:hypothetical protein